MPPHLPPLSALRRVLLLSGILACAVPASPAQPRQTSGPGSADLKRLVEEDAGAFKTFVIQNGISFVPGPEYPAQEAAREKAYRIVLALLDSLDGEAPAQALRDIAACRAAGCALGPEHALVEAAIRLPAWPWQKQEEIVLDRHAVLSGLIAADRDFALVFGRPEGFLRENAPLRVAWSPAPDLPCPPSPEEARILRRLPHSAQALSVAEACRRREYALLIRAAARSQTHLRRLGGYLYGLYVESCHLSSLMATEESTCAAAAACAALQEGLAARLGRGLQLLGREGMLGGGEENQRRAALVERLQRLLSAAKAASSTACLRDILSLSREERRRHLLPFRP